MVRKRGARVIILGEDQNQVSFARRVLMLLHFNPHELNARPIPEGDGSGEHWVIRDYPDQVASNRRERTHQRVALLVSMDADRRSFLERKCYLDGTLRNAGMNTRENTEPVAIWVPSRNIETWLLHFAGSTVDETSDFKNSVREPNFKQAAAGFASEYHLWRQTPEQVTTLPSLIDAYAELTRIV